MKRMNRGFNYRGTVQKADEGRALVQYLAARYGHATEADWRRRIEEGRVLLDGRIPPDGAMVSAGQLVEWRRPPWEEPEAPLAFEVLFEDAAVLAVAKPSGLPTLPGGGFLEHTLLHQVRLRFPDASPLHRLGRGTTGIVLFSRTPEAHRFLTQAWMEHRVGKTYRALVQGSPKEDRFTVDAPIGLAPHSMLGRAHAAVPDGKPSRSDVRVLRRGADASLVEVDIQTGRPHQIRIHMAACGHPLVGDPLYAAGGGFIGGGSALPGELGYLLHAMRLSFPHPATGERVELLCPPPEALS
jgi:23S rRNA pseudouridine1911/1915/1917 synthase